MGIGFMVDWRCAFPVQSPSPAGPSTRPQHQQQQQHHPTSRVRGRETYFETARVSILHSVPEESELLHTHILRPHTQVQNNCEKTEDVNAEKKHGVSNKISGIITSRQLEETASSHNLRFSLLMENIDEIEDLLVYSDLIRLEKDILVQVERLGALKFFHACLARTRMIPFSLNLAFSLTEPKDYPVNLPLVSDQMSNIPVNDQTSNIAIPSRRKKEREFRRQRASKIASNSSALVLPSKIVHKNRDDTVSLTSDLGFKSRSKRLAVARNESKMSMGIKDLAGLEKTRLELEERTGKTATFLRWAQAAGINERALQQRLHFGWRCKDRLLKSARSLVIYLARSYRGMGIAFDDLIQAGNLGVLRGAERFDPCRGYKFSTYVQYWIRKSMSALVTRHSRGIYIPATMEKTIKQLQKARRTLSSTGGRYLQDVEVAELTGVSLAKVRLARECARVVGSTNQKMGDGLNIKITEITADVSIRTPEVTVMRQHMRKDIGKLLKSLHPREHKVLLLRYGLVGGRGMSLEEIGRLLHVSKEWVRKIELAAMTKLRNDEIQGELKHYLHLHFT